MTKELKPCPFCGSTKLKLAKKKTIYKGHKAYVASIRCNSCHARGGTVTNLTLPYAIKEDVENVAIEAWNRREPMDKIVEQLEEQAADDYYDGREDGFRKAIEIVKGGAV